MIRQSGGPNPLVADEDFFVMVSDIPPKRKNTPEEDAADIAYVQKNLLDAIERSKNSAVKSNG